MSCRFPKEVLAAFLNKETGELMEYRHLIGNPKYHVLWKNSYGNELRRLAQGMLDESKAPIQFLSYTKKTSQNTAGETSCMDT